MDSTTSTAPQSMEGGDPPAIHFTFCCQRFCSLQTSGKTEFEVTARSFATERCGSTVAGPAVISAAVYKFHRRLQWTHWMAIRRLGKFVTLQESTTFSFMAVVLLF